MNDWCNTALMRASVEGETYPTFANVRRAFAANFVEHGEVGASLCVIQHGRTVVDLWGGRDAHGRPYTADTLQLVFSATKGIAALCASLLVELGLLDPARPVAYYWPEFAQAGKGSLPVSWVLAHRGGLAALDQPLTADEVFAIDPVVEALAAQRPLWKPGTAHGYHAVTFGCIVGELVKRVTGTSLSRFFAGEIGDPLDLDFWIGLPRQLEPRVAPLIDAPPAGIVPRLVLAAAQRRRHLLWRALTLDGALQSESTAALFNDRRAHAAELASATGIGTARALARVYAAALGHVDGVQLLSDRVLRAATRPEAAGRDRVLLMQSRFGLGFGLHSRMSPFTTAAAFGHYGISGSFGFADPDLGLAAGYVTSRMASDAANDPRTRALRAAILASATAPGAVGHRYRVEDRR